ncbi:hypothetical protein IE994_23895 [Enterobacter hormaechei]|uniref:Uncharacterized protein n=1 Tax=Enterobacter hormaechei TaxID=158836 RepID=A0A927DL55_9ENTR|nr:hypothetical protein [Enterobacter hormaechei]MBD3707658.1 hypothetical protein [Enterobacter hormaechei]MBD3717539.1 hypothetical protein [Enterobacter hormaechei]
MDERKAMEHALRTQREELRRGQQGTAKNGFRGQPDPNRESTHVFGVV